MSVLRVIFIFAVFKTAISDDAGLLKSCGSQDMECLSSTTQNFLLKTSAGIPDFNIKPIDPLNIPEIEYEIPEFDLYFNFKNLNVTGLKNQKMTDFKMDIVSKSVVLQTRIDNANIVSDLTISMKQPAKSISGTYDAKATVIVTSKYNYQLISNKEGVEYFEVGPETITCEAVGAPEVSLDPEFTKVIATDPDATSKKDDYNNRAVELRQAMIGKILSKAYETVMHNLRAAAKAFPKTAFFKDI